MPESAAPLAITAMRPAPVAIPAARRVVVLGIGNSLLSDDGVGVQAVHCLREALPEGDIQWIDGGTLGFALLHYLEGAKALIVIDAAELGAPPGTVQVDQGEAMDRVVGAGRRRSVHEAGLADLLAVARLSDCLPEHRALISVQPQRVDWGDTLSDPVAQALPGVCERARLMAQWWAE